MNPRFDSLIQRIVGLKSAILLVAASVILLGASMLRRHEVSWTMSSASGGCAALALLLLARIRGQQRGNPNDRNLRTALSHAARSGRSEMPESVIVEGACRFPEVRSAYLFAEVPGSRVDPLLLACAGDPPPTDREIKDWCKRGFSVPVPSWPGAPQYRLLIHERYPLTKDRVEQLECYAELAGGYLASGTALREYSLAQNRLSELERQMDLARARFLREARQSLLGKLVSNIAHELNNPLAAVLGSAQCLLQVEKDPQIVSVVQALEAEAKRCKEIVDQVTELAADEEPRSTRIGMHEQIDEVMQLLSYKLRRNRIEIVRNYCEASRTIEGDPALVTQALLNLGNILADLLVETAEPRTIAIATENTAAGFSIRFSSGTGCAKETLERPALRLGLWVAAAILEEYGGKIDSTSLATAPMSLQIEFPSPKKANAPAPVRA